MNRLIIALLIFLGVFLSLGIMFYTPGGLETYDFEARKPEQIEKEIALAEADLQKRRVYEEALEDIRERAEITAKVEEFLVRDARAYRELLAFVERYHTYPSSTARDEVNVHVGKLPPTLGFELPLPDDGKVVGSLSWGTSRHQIIVDTALLPDEVLEFYTERLAAIGYEPWRMPGSRGFLSPEGDFQRTFCHDLSDTELRITASNTDRRFTDLRIHVSKDQPHSQCAQEMPKPAQSSPGQKYMPILNAYPDSNIPSKSGCGHENAYSSQIELRSSASGKEILAHYSRQLLDSDWIELDSGQRDRFYWSIWTFMDDEDRQWEGILYVTESSKDAEKRTVMLQITLVD